MGARKGTEAFISEFVGTFLLIFTIGCNVITGQPVWGGISIACVLTVSIYALGKSSGANFNPAVSLALGMCGKMEWADVGIYIAIQIIAGVIAAFAYVGMFGMHLAFNLGPTKGHTPFQACLVELIYTFMLCFVVLNVAASKMQKRNNNQFYGIAIGFVIVAGAYGAGSVSMGCFNPAVAFALDTASFWIGFQYGPIYMIFEFLGGALAAALFKVCRPEEAEDPEGDLPPLGEGEERYPLSSRLVSEFIGTYMLVLTVGLNVLSGSQAAAFSIAASLMCMIFALGTCSGAHFNPAVTVAILCSGRDKCTPSDGGAYIGVQILGGICAAFTYVFCMNGETFQLKPDLYKWHQVAIAEFMFTFVLAFVVLSVATVKNGLSEYFGFAIGMCVTVGGYAIGKVSGGSLNPAVSIGISSSHIIGGGGFWPCLIYSIIECSGGLMAAAVFKITQPSEYDGLESEAKSA
jgi:aquaporin Z